MKLVTACKRHSISRLGYVHYVAMVSLLFHGTEKPPSPPHDHGCCRPFRQRKSKFKRIQTPPYLPKTFHLDAQQIPPPAASHTPTTILLPCHISTLLSKLASLTSS
jgi:hypothetical protein